DDTFDRRIGGREIGFDSPEGDELTRSEFQEAVSIMASHGAHVAALTAPYSPPTMSGSRVGIPDRSSYNPRWIDRWKGDRRAVATRNASSVPVIALNRFLDPDGGWTDTVNGVGTRGPDRTHLSPEGADLVAGWLAPQLVRLARAPVPTVNASVGVPPASGRPYACVADASTRCGAVRRRRIPAIAAVVTARVAIPPTHRPARGPRSRHTQPTIRPPV